MSNDPLIEQLRSLGHDVRRHGIFKAVVLFARGKTMRWIETETGIKGETLKRTLEIIRVNDVDKLLSILLADKARITSPYLNDLHGFWTECELVGDAYRARGRALRQAKSPKRTRKRHGPGAGS